MWTASAHLSWPANGLTSHIATVDGVQNLGAIKEPATVSPYKPYSRVTLKHSRMIFDNRGRGEKVQNNVATHQDGEVGLVGWLDP